MQLPPLKVWYSINVSNVLQYLTRGNILSETLHILHDQGKRQNKFEVKTIQFGLPHTIFPLLTD